MKINKKPFGMLSNGKKIDLYTLSAGELTLSISTLGATLTSLYAPSRKTGVADILLGYSTLGGYAADSVFLGVTVGRFANRIGGARFTIDDKTYTLFKNDGENCLHAGLKNFGRQVWSAEPYEDKGGVYVRFELKSPAYDEGFPGNLKAAVSYGLTQSNEMTAIYEATVDAPCPVNFTNHAYFNLAGEGRGDTLSHELIIHASEYLPIDEQSVPTGEVAKVELTPFDFRLWKPIGMDIDKTAAGGQAGYDHCYVVTGIPGKLRPAAEVFERASGRIMRVFTTQPGIQFYSGNYLHNIAGKTGSVYNKHAGFCLETQHFPDSPNKPQFPSCIYGPDRKYVEKAAFKFDW
ncbi:MAG: galactose mutarotase [Treponema sp.]|jgi:aldose 1-epimerase|nr:galactose mutarotase [Treponema sp.]